VLLPLVRLGRQEEALRHHRRGYQLIRNNSCFVDHVAEHLLFLTLTENLDQALRLVERHYVWTETNKDMSGRFRFFRAAWFLFEILSEKGKFVRLHLPNFSLVLSEQRLLSSQTRGLV